MTGATGYIGGRLVPQLLEQGYRVRCFVRNARRLTGHDWYDRVEVVEGDVLEPETLPAGDGGLPGGLLPDSFDDRGRERVRGPG